SRDVIRSEPLPRNGFMMWAKTQQSVFEMR
ncbi:MAG: hypothetical protein EZS28_050385, partial [Streblomastix strix]